MDGELENWKFHRIPLSILYLSEWKTLSFWGFWGVPCLTRLNGCPWVKSFEVHVVAVEFKSITVLSNRCMRRRTPVRRQVRRWVSCDEVYGGRKIAVQHPHHTYYLDLGSTMLSWVLFDFIDCLHRNKRRYCFFMYRWLWIYLLILWVHISPDDIDNRIFSDTHKWFWATFNTFDVHQNSKSQIVLES